MDIKQHRKPKRLISLTPLIDVVFVLLVFLMISSNHIKWRHLPLHSVQAGGAGATSESILLRLQPHSLDINGQGMTPEELNAFIRQKVAVTPDLHISLQPGKQVVLQRTVEVLDQIAAAGGRSASITR